MLRTSSGIFAVLFFALTLCLSSSCLAQNNSQEFVESYSNASDGPLGPAAVDRDFEVTGNETSGYGEASEGNSGSPWMYGGMVLLALVGIGLIAFIGGALKRRGPPQRIQL